MIWGVIVLSNSMHAQTIIPPGNVSGIWDPSGNPYIVTGDLNVVNSLIIQPGVIVDFQAGVWKIEAGAGAKIIARGTADNYITFQPHQGAFPGSWSTLYLNGTGNDDTLAYCIIRNGTDGIHVYNSKPVIENCIIYGNSNSGINLDYSDLSRSVQIIGCTLYDNQTGITLHTYGFGITDTVNIYNCTIFRNSGNGVYVYGTSYSIPYASITNVISCGNGQYGIANGFNGYIGSHNVIYGCFWGNGSGDFQGISGTGFGHNGPYHNANGDSCDVNFNIYNDPAFIDSAHNDFHLQPNSKCIDAGTSVINGSIVMDPDNTFPEIGSYHFEHSQPLFNVSPKSLLFGDVRLGLAKIDSITVKNAGGGILKIDSAISRIQDFGILPVGGSISASDSMKFYITFSPMDTGVRSGVIYFMHNATGSPDSISVNGVGIAPIFSVIPGQVSFGDALVGTIKTDSVTATNSGTTTLNILAAGSNDGQFSITPATVSIAPSTSKRFYISFTPGDTGVKSGSVFFIHNAAGSPDTVLVGGRGVAPIFKVVPSELNIGDVEIDSSKTDSVIVTNIGTADLVISSVSSDNPKFNVSPVSGNISAGKSLKFLIVFKPSFGGEQMGHIVFEYNVQGSPHEVLVRGRGIGGDQYPRIRSVKDVPNDQGGKVTLLWTAAPIDTNPATLPYYSIWRSMPGGEGDLHKKAIIPMNKITPDFRGSACRITSANGTAYAWEWIANQPAHRFASYTYTAPTLFDSMSITDGKHYFLVSAHTADPNIFYDSNIDSGYSVDNLPPLRPRNLAASIVSGGILLNWDPNPEADLRQYAVYRSTTPNTYPDTPYAVSKDTNFTDNHPLNSAALYYVIRAQDIHDNLSLASNEVVVGPQGVHESVEIPGSFQLRQNYPNPFNPSTEIGYQISEATHVKITIYNSIGVEIATLVDMHREAGYYSVSWNGFDSKGTAVPSGIYIYKMQTISFVSVKKMTLLK